MFVARCLQDDILYLFYHLCTCMSHSGAKKAHDWAVDQLADHFRTTHKVKTQEVVKIRGQHRGDLELAAYLVNEAGPVPLVLDLRITHDRIGSSANPALNGTLTHPNNIDESLNKLLKIRFVNIAQTTIIIHQMLSLLCRLLLVRLVDCTVNLSDFYSYSLIGKLTAFLQLQEFSQRNQT